MFVGNKKSIALLKRIVDRGEAAQSYIFSGPESVGKFFIAKFFSRSIITGADFNVSDDGNVLPDLIILEPEVEEKRGVVKERDIPIEKIRDVQKNLALFPYSGKRKILIINNAHRMTENSQNALLKTLEEPNPTSIIILIVHMEGKLLPTIKSRCQKIAFNLVSPEEIREKLGATDEIIKLSLGRPGLAKKIMGSKEEFDSRREALEKLRNLSKSGINQRLKIAESLSKNISEAIKVLELWVWALHAPAIKDVKLFKIIEKIEKSADDIRNTNANARLVLENLIINL